MHVSHKKNFSESHTVNPFLTELVRSTWLDIDSVIGGDIVTLVKLKW